MKHYTLCIQNDLLMYNDFVVQRLYTVQYNVNVLVTRCSTNERELLMQIITVWSLGSV